MTAYRSDWFTEAEETQARAERGWLDEPVQLDQAMDEWAATHPMPEPPRLTQADLERSDALARERALWDAAPDDVADEPEFEAGR